MKIKLNEGKEKEDELYEAFKTIDTKNRGHYDVYEMKAMMAKYGEKLTDQEAM